MSVCLCICVCVCLCVPVSLVWLGLTHLFSDYLPTHLLGVESNWHFLFILYDLANLVQSEITNSIEERQSNALFFAYLPILLIFKEEGYILNPFYYQLQAER